MPRPRILVNALSMSSGGGVSYVTNLLRELGRDDRGKDFTVIVKPAMLDGLDTSGVDVETPWLPGGAAQLPWRVAYEELILPFRARRYDLLYCVSDLAPPWAAAPSVVLLRNLNIYDRRWYDDARTRVLVGLVRLGLPRVRRVLFPSRAAADLISELIPVPRDRVRVVHYGISVDTFGEGPGPEPNGTRYVFLPAAIEKHKNLRVLIESLTLVKDSELELWVAGTSTIDPPHQGHLEALARELGVGDRVRFLGAVPYRDILAYYRSATAFVFPSFIETFGHPLLEAMLVGTPAVASDIPAFREIAGDAALYFPPSDAEALAKLLDRVQGDPEATRQRVELGKQRATEFSWKRCVDDLCAVFDEVLGEGAR